MRHDSALEKCTSSKGYRPAQAKQEVTGVSLQARIEGEKLDHTERKSGLCRQGQKRLPRSSYFPFQKSEQECVSISQNRYHQTSGERSLVYREFQNVSKQTSKKVVRNERMGDYM